MTNFALKLSLVRVESGHRMAEPLNIPVSAGTETGAEVAGGKFSVIWVVDDEPGVADLVGMALRMAGHEVVVFHNPLVLLQAADVEGVGGRLGLLFTDQSMPQMDGMDLIRALRGGGWSGPAIVASGHGGAAEWEASRRLAGVRFLPKPFQLDALVCMVEAALAEGRKTSFR